MKLNSLIRDLLIGKLLGDGHLETQNGGKTWRLKVEHSIKQKAYVLHQYKIFSFLVLTPPKIVSKISKDSISKNMMFQTISLGSFRFYGQQFYCKNKKVLPKIIGRMLNARVLAYWYLDDGSMKSRESKGIFFNTHSFSLKEVKVLCLVLEKNFSLECWPRKQEKSWQIYVSGKSYERIRDLILKYVIPEMLYKFPFERRKKTQLPKK